MAVQVSFDPSGTPLLPHLILATKSGRLIREILWRDMKERLEGGEIKCD